MMNYGDPKKETVKFICKNCGCKFEEKKNECDVLHCETGCVLWRGFKAYYHKCPDCDLRVQSEYKEILKWKAQ